MRAPLQTHELARCALCKHLSSIAWKSLVQSLLLCYLSLLCFSCLQVLVHRVLITSIGTNFLVATGSDVLKIEVELMVLSALLNLIKLTITSHPCRQNPCIIFETGLDDQKSSVPYQK